MARCKVCSSKLLDQINEKIIAGISYADIESWCKANDFDCSHMSIKRHVDNGHIKAPVVNLQTILSTQLTSQIEITQDELDNFQQSTANHLKRIAILQLRVVEQKQIEFTQEISRFPHVEIQTLKNIIEMCNSLDLFNNVDEKPKHKGLSDETVELIKTKVLGIT